MTDHCRISSEIRSNFGQFEVIDFFTDDRVGVFSLLTPKVNPTASHLNRSTHDAVDRIAIS
jgi:hypothetical protein